MENFETFYSFLKKKYSFQSFVLIIWLLNIDVILFLIGIFFFPILILWKFRFNAPMCDSPTDI